MEAAPLSLTNVAGGFIGGIGLFLLGMHMLTEGLKLAAGRALEDLLGQWTSSRSRGLCTGFLITTLVQSSTAVTIATIGFVNSGLLTLRNSLWVIFGSNLGSTMNAWLVAALGFNFKIDAFALPFVGVGAVLMLVTRGARSKALGQALAGFGILFLGIDVLKDMFSGLGGHVSLEEFARPGIAGYLILVGIGTLLTVLMQTSGAVIALIITAAQGGLMSIEAACAMVIGTNIGTTSTAILAALGATANAKRVAAAHVVFNLITGLVALGLLPVLINFIEEIQQFLAQPASPAVMVAMFHSTFNLLGVALMVPLDPWLIRSLSQRFRSRQEEASQPRYLDHNVVSVPDLALRALRLELAHTQGLACEGLRLAAAPVPDEARIARRRDTLETLALAISDYIRRISTAALPATLVEALARGLRVLRYQQATSDLSQHGAALHGHATACGLEQVLFQQALSALAEACDGSKSEFSPAAMELALENTETAYATLKEALLVAGAAGHLDIRDMENRLRQGSLYRRAAEQLVKAQRHLLSLETPDAHPLPDDRLEAIPG
ncbi:Na/Pi cotransporter family protein [Azovibrio restrictus]|uniref:Na/Pi cotransporter family protein n=1 Tax=Azovibrio restrictus TaxID=146938 RepID=UPI0026EE9154|nr:Na/Pi symporter [Azovibrio restrictus]MDD3482473.1 Na/Pi symporter [Azovibrio restrictus]